MFCDTAERFVAWLEETMGDMVTQHFVGNMLVHVTGDEAEGEVYTVNHHLIGGDTPHRYTAGGRYLDKYVRIGGRWLFAERHRVIDWWEQVPISDSAHAGGALKGVPGPTDPSYELLPHLAQHSV